MNALYLDLLNSDWHDWRGTGKDEDLLLKPVWIEQFVARWDLSVVVPPDPTTLIALQSLRSLLMRIVQAHLQEQGLAEQSIADLNVYLAASLSSLRLVNVAGHYHLQHVPDHNDWTWVMHEIAASFATLLIEHEPSRLKHCENPDCGWFYYDESPYQSRRWCEDSCANLMRVRRFRARRRVSNEVKI